jgi:hypothetical protein
MSAHATFLPIERRFADVRRAGRGVPAAERRWLIGSLGPSPCLYSPECVEVWNSRNSISRILHRTLPQSPKARSSAHLHLVRDSYSKKVWSCSGNSGTGEG